MPTSHAYFAYNSRLNKFEKFDYAEAFKKADTKIPIDEFFKLKG
jgi:hypothetical protein